MNTGDRRFRIALSFPGEHRAFVSEVAEYLAAQLGRTAILYDTWYEAEFARPDLDTHLQALYHDQSDLIAVFLCADYERKEWCGLEWRAVRDLIKRRRAQSVMPLRLDDTEIPGLLSIDGYVWIGNRSAAQIAGLILERLRLIDPESVPTPLRSPTDGCAAGWLHRFRRQGWLFRLALILTLTILLALGGLGLRSCAPSGVPLAGTVLDGDGRPIPGVTVSLPDQGLRTQTDPLGHFALVVPADGPAQVQIIATTPGFAPHRQYVLSGSRRLSFTMRPE